MKNTLGKFTEKPVWVGKNPPMDYTVDLDGVLEGIDVYVTGHTSTRDGMRLVVVWAGEEAQEGEYSLHKYGPDYFPMLAKDVAEWLNILLDLEGRDANIDPVLLKGVMKRVFNDCESRYGNPIPDSDYEAKVAFI